jgi:multiple sugar transport system permease protein
LILNSTSQQTAGAGYAAPAPTRLAKPRYHWFVIPGLLVTFAIIVFPWVFTVWMSFHEWKLGGAAQWVGLRNYIELATNQRFLESIWHTFYFTAVAVVLPLVLGTFAAVVFHREFPFRGVLRTIFIMPMMATPVAIALVWTMMFHPQLGVLNYLLSLVGIGPSEWVFARHTVIPSLALVEVWLWTPFVMIIVLGGLAAVPTEPYESAQLDGATQWQMFWRITFPLVLPFIVVAGIIRTIDALKAFEVIYVISNGGPGTASETINLYLYSQAFAYYNVGNASAVVVVFFAIIIVLSLVLLWARERAKWNN